MANASGFRECVACHTERAADTLDKHGRCPFCEDAPIPEPPPPPEPPPTYLTPEVSKKTPIRKPQHEESEAPKDTLPYAAPQPTVNADPQVELAQRELCRRKLLPFIQRFRPKYTAGWVHQDICRRLERFVKQVEEKKSPRLLLMCPPRMGKSEIGSRNFPAWVFGHHPDWEIIAASHTAGLTMSFSRYIRDVLRDPAYSAVFPQTKLDPSSQSVENWNLTSAGGYLAAGVGTGITGRGAHILLLDDLVKDIEAADSATITDNTWEWYGSTAYTRLAPGGGVLGIMTWWSEADWAGRIQETMKSGDGDMFEVVKYPAINDEGDEYILADDTVAQIPPGFPVPEGAALTRPMNTAVHPDRYDTEAMLRIKRNLVATGQKRVWQALYQQNPLPDEGMYFTKDMIRYGQFERRAEYRVYQAWDFAITEKNISDWTVCATIMQTPDDDLILVDVMRFRSADGIGLVDAMLDQVEIWRPDFLGVEDGQIWKALSTLFTRRCQERKLYPSLDVLTPLTDKLVRAGPLRGRMQMGKFYVQAAAPWRSAWETEMMYFPAGRHDDQVDATSWAVRMTLNHQAPREPHSHRKEKSWKDKLRVSSSVGAGHMAA